MLIYTVMSGINTRNGAESDSKKSSYFEKLWYALALASLLHISAPTQAQTNIPTNTNNTEQVDGSVDKYNWIYIPAVYKSKLEKFISDNNVFKVKWALMFTADFVLWEMENDRWIGKENQLLFVWHSIYKQVTGEDLYDGEDWDVKTAENFGNKVVGARMRACWQKYKNWIIKYMDEVSAEVNQQTAEVNQQTAEVKQQTAEVKQQAAEYREKTIKSLNESLNLFKEFYNSYKQHPNDEQLEKFRKNAEELVPLWNKYGIDYKKVLTPEMLKFYGIAEPDIASNRWTYDIINHYNPVNTSPEVAEQWYEQREINEVRERFKNRIALILANEIADNLSKLSNDNVA